MGGIDPDLAWDEDGTAHVTFSGLHTSGEQVGQHLGIQQVRVDLAAGKVLEAPRSVLGWRGSSRFRRSGGLAGSRIFWTSVPAWKRNFGRW